jgi:transcription elongation factor Elf1
MKVVTISKLDYVDCKEWFGEVFECPKCNDYSIMSYKGITTNYCPTCGVKLNWNITDDEFRRSDKWVGKET